MNSNNNRMNNSNLSATCAVRIRAIINMQRLFCSNKKAIAIGKTQCEKRSTMLNSQTNSICSGANSAVYCFIAVSKNGSVSLNLSRYPSLNIIKGNPILHIDSISHTIDKQKHRIDIFQTTLLSTANQNACMHIAHITKGFCLCVWVSALRQCQWLNKKTQKFINIYGRAYVPPVSRACSMYVP